MTTTGPLLERITAEYREMPGLSLTAAQAARLWGLDRAHCAAVLQALVAAGRLRRTPEGRFCAPEAAERAAWRRRGSATAA
jgi:hypothetical protein